jgi:DNA-binding CsgD family transcriptional regulator
MPTGEMVVFSFDRLGRDGPHGSTHVAALNRFHPHLARAGLVAARLGLERAVATTSALQMIGLPVAMLSASGRVMATNALFEQLLSHFLPVAFGRLAIANAGANRLFQQAIEAAAEQAEPAVRSIPIAETDEHGACVVHLVPLRRNALDLFPGGAIVLAVSVPRKSALVPSADVLTGLFDLTPAETRFAMALAAGRSPRAAARDIGVTESTGRTYLSRIFAKTGTHRQTELINLLQAAHPFRSGVHH